ncbi:IS1 family transposase [uncultured Desulfobacter sp.]|uniref:IS1 family transposase n=1 Tax=uncultured Desulfobacter sp. TaxID=240139 RepID=UPI00374958CD
MARTLEKLADFPIRYFHTDNWQSYSKFIPAEKHIIGKDNTWRIERRNLQNPYQALRKNLQSLLPIAVYGCKFFRALHLGNLVSKHGFFVQVLNNNRN